MKSILKTFFTLLALILTVGLGYYLYMYNGGIEDSTNTDVETDAATDAAQFLSRLNQLKQVQLNSDILSDERFSSLSAFSSPVNAEPIGRENPFEVN